MKNKCISQHEDGVINLKELRRLNSTVESSKRAYEAARDDYFEAKKKYDESNGIPLGSKVRILSSGKIGFVDYKHAWRRDNFEMKYDIRPNSSSLIYNGMIAWNVKESDIEEIGDMQNDRKRII